MSLQSLHHIHSLGHLSKDNVLSVEPSRDNGGDEELRSVGSGSSVGHAQQTGSVVLQLEVLIRELGSVDGLSSSAVSSGEVSSVQKRE